MKLLLSIFILIFSSIFDIVNNQNYFKNCTTNDVEKIYTRCKDNLRDLMFTKKTNCKLTEENKNLLFAKIQNITCDTKCQTGSIFDFDGEKKESSCLKCPANSYSTGGNLQIDGHLKQWKNMTFPSKGFATSCLISTLGFEFQNTACSAFNVSQDGSYLVSGESNLTDAKYLGILIYGFHSKNTGELKFKYKKDTKDDNIIRNGQFLLYFDYDLLYTDNDLDSQWKTYSTELKPGDHHIVWV